MTAFSEYSKNLNHALLLFLNSLLKFKVFFIKEAFFPAWKIMGSQLLHYEVENLNPFHATGLFWYPLKTSENF